MDKFEKAKKELEEAIIADPNVIIRKIDFDCAKALTDYLEFVNQWHEDSAKSQIVIGGSNGMES